MFRDPTPLHEDLCLGEYNWVARESRDLPALVLAHATPCTRAEATALLRQLAREHLPAADALALRIGWGAKYGRGGDRTPRKREVRYECPVTGRIRYRMPLVGRDVPFVALPKVAMEHGGPWWVGESTRLRVGLVLHEFAHVLTYETDGTHGNLFTKSLDDLIAAWIARNLHTAALSGSTERMTMADAGVETGHVIEVAPHAASATLTARDPTEDRSRGEAQLHPAGL